MLGFCHLHIKFVLFFLFLTGCVSTPREPEFQYVYRNAALRAQIESGSLSSVEYDNLFYRAVSTCQIQAFQIPIPSPSCSTIPAPDCTGLVGFALGMCRSQLPTQRCDYSSVNAARFAQEQVLLNCMRLQGWQRFRE